MNPTSNLPSVSLFSLVIVLTVVVILVLLLRRRRVAAFQVRSAGRASWIAPLLGLIALA